MAEPLPPSEPSAPQPPQHPLSFLYGLVGGPLLFLVSVWLIDVTGRFFWVLALLGVLAFGVGVIQGLVFALRSLATRPVPSIAVLAVLGGLGFLAVSNAQALGAAVRRLTADKELGGRYAGGDFSLEYPTGWRQRDADGFEVWGYRPSGTGKSQCLDSVGVMRSRRDDYTLETYVQRQRDDYGGSEHWELLEDKPATVGGLPGREFVVRGDTHVAHLFITVREQRGYIVLAQACRTGEEGAREELLWDVARSFRF